MVEKYVLQSDLLDPHRGDLEAPSHFAACLNAHGLYNTLQFALRLSPRVHALLNAVPSGIMPANFLDQETLQAYSTYLHETVHWWQHIGSIAGFVFSLSYLGQSHSNLDQLCDFLNQIGPKKSIKTWAKNAELDGHSPTDDALKCANIAVNNTIDVEFYKILSMKPDLAEDIFNDTYFECVGHSYCVAYIHALGMLSTTFDVEFEHFPDAREWEYEFQSLREARHLAFYHGSPIMRGPVGLHALFEGQARFIQLQYLSFGLRNGLTCEELKRRGYFTGIYAEAFEAFLKLSKSEPPDEIDNPLIGLFLLICDLALNPTAAFPLQITQYNRFVIDVDPGIRFGRLCQAVAEQHPELRTAISDYSREEYVRVTEILTKACGYDHPLAALKNVVLWTNSAPGVVQAMLEKESFNYQIANLPIRMLFSHFAAFSQDKLSHPEFFCWPGAWMTGHRVSEDVRQLFMVNQSLFADKGDDDGVFARNFPGKDPQGLRRSFNTFYSNNILYDLTRQWILHDGPFEYDFRWLTQAYTKETMAEWAKSAFEHLYGSNPDQFEFF